MYFSRLLSAGFVLFALLTAQLLGETPEVDADPSGDLLPKGAIARMGSIRLRHATWLTAVEFSPNDQRIASADSNRTIRIWDAKTGRMLHEFPEQTGSKLAFSPDGKVLATSGFYERQVTLWDVASGERLRGLNQNARSLAFTPDGAHLIAGGRDGIVRMWLATTGQLAREFKGHEGGLYAVALSPDGKMIASGGGGDGTSPRSNEVRLWNADSGEEIAQLQEDEGDLQGLKRWIYALDFSADGKTLAVASPYAVRIWDIERRKQLHRLEKCSYDAAFSPIANQLVLPGEFGIYDPTTGKQTVKLGGDVGVYGCVAYSHDGKTIVSGNKQGLVQLWDAETGKEIVRRSGHSLGVRAVAFSPDGSVAASVSRHDGTLRLWGTASGKQLRKFDIHWSGPDVWWSNEGSDVFFPPYGREVATWTYEGTLRFWELASLENRTVDVAQQSVTGLTMSRDGNLVAVVEYGGSRPKIALYELDGGTRLKALELFSKRSSSDAWISSMAISPDNKTLAIGVRPAGEPSPDRTTKERTIQFWDISEGEVTRRFRTDENAPGRIVFSPDGKLLASAATGSTPVQLWKVADGSQAQVIAEKDVGRSWYDSSPLAFSPDGKLLAAAGRDFQIVVWELATENEFRRFSGHMNAVTSLDFSPDGRTLLSGSEDATLLLWDVSNVNSNGSGEQMNRRHIKELEQSWRDLASADGDIVSRAIGLLVSVPDHATKLFKERLKPAPILDAAEVPKLVTDLSHEETSKRKEAALLLKQNGIKAAPELYKALASKPNIGVRREIESILEAIGEFPIPPDDLRRARAIQVLERIGTADALRVLQSLGDNPDAKTALERLEERERRPKTKVLVDERK